MTRIGIAGVVSVAVLLAACGDDDGAGDTSAAVPDELMIEDAWIRSTPDVVSTAAVYVTLQSAVDDRLVAVEVDPEVASAATMHETVTASSDDELTTESAGDAHGDHGEMGDDMDGSSGGLTTMEQRSEIDLPAGETVEFAPGGLHIMLEELVDPLEAGETVDLELQFEKAGTQDVSFDVLDDAPDAT